MFLRFRRLRLYFVSIQYNCSPELSQFSVQENTMNVSVLFLVFFPDMIRYVYLVVSCSVESVIQSVMSFSLTENRCSAPFRAEHRLCFCYCPGHIVCERERQTRFVMI